MPEMENNEFEATITCPECDFAKTEMMSPDI